MDEQPANKTKKTKTLPETQLASTHEPEKINPIARFFGFNNLRSLGLLILIILAFRWSVLSPYHVPTASMEPTIKVGDRLLGWKLAYDFKIPFTDYKIIKWGRPQRGDIIVFRYPRDPSIDFVKRVVGLPGDRIKVVNNILYINGKEQKLTRKSDQEELLSDIVDHPDQKELFEEDLEGYKHWVIFDRLNEGNSLFGFISEKRYANFPPHGDEFTVPEGEYFVMGDNRDNSTDSREWGGVPESYIRGKAAFVLWSAYSKENSWAPQIRWYRFGSMLH